MTPELREAWRKEPLKFQHALWPDVAFYDKQVEIIHSVRDDAETFVPAGNMLGKDFVAGFLALWFFICHYQADKSRNWVRVITTSVKDDHLDVLWGEIARFVAGSRVPLSYKEGGPLVVTSHEIRHANDLNLTGGNAGSYLKGRVSAKGEGMAGHHAEHTLLIIDEASGVDDEVYTQGDTWAKHKLVIGNPNPCVNFFFRGVKGGDLVE
jgi:hypothetical protein